MDTVRAVERSFFDQVLDAFEGFVVEIQGQLHSSAHRRGLKIWYDDAPREHYEAQFIRVDGELRLEIGFHAEYPKPEENDRVLERLVAHRPSWSDELGETAEVGVFIGADRWRRISEVWEPLDPDDVDDDPDLVIEVAARLADYVSALEPARRSVVA